MALPATDDFTGLAASADLDSRTNWSKPTGGVVGPIGQPSVGGNLTSEVASGNDWGVCYWDADTFANDQYSQLVSTESSASFRSVGPAVRIQTGALQCYAAAISTSHGVQIYRVDATDTETALGTPASYTSGATYRIEAEGTTIRIKENGTTVTSATDSTYSSGYAGIAAFGNGTESVGDTWEAGNLSTASTAKNLLLLGVG